MGIPLRCFWMAGAVCIGLSCGNGRSVEPNAEDRGSYELGVAPTSLQSYRGGGGIFVLSMTPSADFGGKVVLSVIADPTLRAELSRELLTSANRVAEVTLRPDTTSNIGDRSVAVTSLHACLAETLVLGVSIVQPDVPSTYGYANKLFDEFVQWIQDERPELGIGAGQAWFRYNNHPILGLGTPGYWTFLSQTWDVSVCWAVRPTSPAWVLLRPRGEPAPIFAAHKELGVPFHEIPVHEVPVWLRAPSPKPSLWSSHASTQGSC